MNFNIYIYRYIYLLTALAFLNILSARAQYTQTIRGKIIDKQSQIPLPGATIIIANSDPLKGTTSDVNGLFRIEQVEVGRQQLKISFLGYKELNIPVLVTSGKEIILNIEMEESVVEAKEVVITATRDKSKSSNEMSTVSSRGFNAEEANRYAGSLSDPARMASNYAGVMGTSDARNDIIIRGNSPSGLLWRLDGYDIPNPNHFSTAGASGGPISILNNNLLANSDFVTGAFAAEYGNALSGVFDLKLRNGNNEKREYTGQIGFNGFELNAEGPISKKNGSSYIVAYRYSALTFMQKIGINYGSSAIPYYQDATVKLNFPLKKGVFSVFGIGGLSHADMVAKEHKKGDLFGMAGFDIYSYAKMGAVAANYTHYINNKTYAKFTIGTNGDENKLALDTVNSLMESFKFRRELNSRHKYSFNGFINTKFSSRLTCKTGFMTDQISYNNTNNRYYGNIEKKIFESKGTTYLLRAYTEATYKISDQLQINPGLNYVHLFLNNTYAIEPRLGISWQFAPTQRLSAAYGIHNRTQELQTYFVETKIGNEYYKTNHDLKFTGAMHYVLGYDWSITENLRIKAETYYQTLSQIPVTYQPSPFSMINAGADFVIPYVDSLESKGTGTNYGMEFTLEHFMTKGFYFLFTTSLFQSKYKGSDGIERNTAFNGNYISNFLCGKEFKIGKNNVLLIDLKVAYAGGRRYTPVDIDKSRLVGYTVYDNNHAFEEQFPEYFRPDIRVGFRQNKKKITQEWAVMVQNFTGHKNAYTKDYSPKSGEVYTTYQLGVFPVALYRINF